jgi:hypothetical protein
MGQEEPASALTRSKTFSGATAKRRSAALTPTSPDETGVRRHHSLSVRRPLIDTSVAGSSSSHPASPTSPTANAWTPTPEERSQMNSAQASSTNVGDAQAALSGLGLEDSPTKPPKLFPLVTSFKESPPPRGASSAAAYVKPIGHSFQHASEDAFQPPTIPARDRGAATAAVGAQAERWMRQKAAITGKASAHAASPSREYPLPHVPEQQQQQRYSPSASFQPFAGAAPLYGKPIGPPPFAPNYPPPVGLEASPSPGWQPALPKPMLPMMATPAGVLALAAQKGYNPVHFDCKPRNVGTIPRLALPCLIRCQAHFCVIKSYTEEDVHKSIKYEIWSSTVLGNKVCDRLLIARPSLTHGQRLDRVYREGAASGPVYLFFR